MKLHSSVALITNSSSEIYGTINSRSADSMKAAIDMLLEAVGYSERFDDLFIIRYVPHNLFMSSSIEEFDELYDQYEIDEVPISDEDVDDYYDKLLAYQIPRTNRLPREKPPVASPEYEASRVALARQARRYRLWQRLSEQGVMVVFDDTEWPKPVSDITVAIKNPSEDSNSMAMFASIIKNDIWYHDTWDWN